MSDRGDLRRAAAAMLAAGAVLSVLPAGRVPLPVLCPYRRITGRLCPVCGMTTSVVAALRLQPVRSLQAHPLGLPVTVAACVLVVTRPPGLAVRPARSLRRPGG